MIKTKYQFIRFAKLAPKPGHKTEIWAVVNNHSNGQLGTISWYGPWRQYCYFVEIKYQVILSKGCLRDIAEFIQLLMEERKGGLR